MTTAINSATYQGYSVKAVSWQRSEGLNPDRGHVVIDYSVLKNLKLGSAGVPWARTDELEAPGILNIHDWWNLFGSSKRTVTNDRKFAPIADGFRPRGPLILRTELDGKVEEVRYDDLYVTNAEEISENLAVVLEHKEGEIRVDIADVRRYSGKYGGVVGRVNCRKQNGKYDPRTIKQPPTKRVTANSTVTSEEVEGTPWSFEEVVRWLFSQIPGSQFVSFARLGVLPPPEEIDHVGSSPVAVLQELLDNYGLVAKMLPNGSWFIARKNALGFIAPGEIATEIGKKEKRKHIAYEIKSVAPIDTPWVVVVLGGRRYRQESMEYVPAFHDVDGKLYRLWDVDKVFDGYTLERVNRQAAKNSSKNFQDVPPAPFKRDISASQLRARLKTNVRTAGTTEGLTQDELHYKRRSILREEAYRLYAPLPLFENAPKNKNGAPYFSDLDDRTFPFLPIGSVPLFESELTEPIRAQSFKGDLGRIVLAPPIVRAAYIDEALYTNRKELERRWDSVIAGWEEVRFWSQFNAFTLQNILVNLRDENLKADRLAQAAEFIESEPLEKLLNSFGRQSETMSGRISREFIRRMAEIKRKTLDEIANLQVRIDSATQGAVDAINTVKQLKAKRDADFAALTVFGGLQGVGQIPWGIVPPSIYSLQPSTGILTFSRVSATVNHPVVFDPEDLVVWGDGMVYVTYGHPVDYNETSDYTSIIFSRDGRGGTRLAGANRPTAVLPHVIRDPDLIMFERQNADPINFKSCVEQAEKKAKPILEGPDSTEGFTTQFSGFVPCILEAGVNAVQYEWAGGVAHTFVVVHSPGWDRLAR